MHQMSFAQSNSAVNVQRVVRPGWRLRYRSASRVSKLIGRSDNEGVEGVPRIEAGGTAGDGRWKVLLQGRQRFGKVNGPWCFVGLLFGDEVDGEIRPPDFAHRLGNDAGVVLHQPILEQRIRD